MAFTFQYYKQYRKKKFLDISFRGFGINVSISVVFVQLTLND